MSHAVIIGADVAGLTAAYELSRNRYPVTVMESGKQVGGAFRTESFEGYRVDLCGYGFRTDIAEVQSLWDVFSGNSFLGERGACTAVCNEPIRAGIYFRDRLFNYPFSFTNALKHIGPIDLSLAFFSYCDRWLAQPKASDGDDFETAETWLKKRFGTHLYNILFASYFHKLWGRAARRLHSDCAIEMISGFSNSRFFTRKTTDSGRSRNRFKCQYPASGVGQVWQRAQALVEQQGTQVKLNTVVKKLVHDGQRLKQVVFMQGGGGQGSGVQGGTLPLPVPLSVSLSGSDCVLSSLPLATLVRKFDPPAPANVLAAADCLQYRSVMVVALVLNHNVMFAEHELHIHSPTVRVSRIQNFKNWSLEYVADYQKTCLGLTYLCDEGDALWNMADQDLVQLAFRELILLRLIPEEVAEEMVEGPFEDWRLLEMGKVVRHANAQPIRSVNYYQHKAVVQRYLARFENLTVVGTDGVEASTAQDMRMYNGLIAARNVMQSRSRVSSQEMLATDVKTNVKTKLIS